MAGSGGWTDDKQRQHAHTHISTWQKSKLKLLLIRKKNAQFVAAKKCVDIWLAGLSFSMEFLLAQFLVDTSVAWRLPPYHCWPHSKSAMARFFRWRGENCDFPCSDMLVILGLDRIRLMVYFVVAVVIGRMWGGVEVMEQRHLER